MKRNLLTGTNNQMRNLKNHRTLIEVILVKTTSQIRDTQKLML